VCALAGIALLALAAQRVCAPRAPAPAPAAAT
jgi:hypothetical protein